MLAEATPAHVVAFDLLALGDDDLTRRALRRAAGRARGGARGRELADPRHAGHERRARSRDGGSSEFEGAGLDGVVAKPLEGTYQPDKRVMFKIKHERTADCVVAGYRLHKSGPDAVGSLLLGLYDDEGVLANVGVIGAFPMERRRELLEELQPLGHDVRRAPVGLGAGDGRGPDPAERRGQPLERRSKDLSFVPLRPERVVEVRYDHMEGNRFRHTAQFVRWRPDRDPRSCTFEQLEEPVSFDLAEILGTR